MQVSPSHLALLVAVALVGCTKSADRSTPEAFAKGLVGAMNSGDISAVKSFVGTDFLVDRQKACVALRSTPPPTRRSEMGELGRVVYELEMNKRSTNCEDIPADFEKLLKRLKNSSGLKLGDVTSGSKPNTRELAIKMPTGVKTDRWKLKLVGEVWALDDDNFGWSAASMSMGNLTMWVAAEDLKDALK
jgi:hypothetical protein